MFNHCDAVLCFYLLLGQKYIIDNNPNFHKPQVWFAKQELITNDNIFDINKLIKLQDTSQEIRQVP